MSTLKKVVREAEIETRASQMNKTVNCVEHKDDKFSETFPTSNEQLVNLTSGHGHAVHIISILASSDPDYHYQVKVESYASHLQYVAEYELGNDGTFEIALSILLAIAVPKADEGRDMLYLLVCDADATKAFLNLPSSSYPLEDESPDEFVYQSFKVVSGSMAQLTPPPYSMLDQESGQDGILRSCLNHPPGSNSNDHGSQGDSPCFYCPNNYPMSYTGQVSGIAESEGWTSFGSIFYGLSALVWGITSFVWTVHIHSAARDAVIELQTKMKLIPVTQTLYSIATFGDLSAEDKLVGTARSLVQNIAVLAQLVALAVFAEVVVVIAKGWKITRPALLPREVQWIRFVTLSWAASFAVLKHAEDKQLAVVIVWGLSWACVVFMIWYNSAFNLNMLKYQLAMVRQLDLDPSSRLFTPS
ncbi:hypothetical protein GQ600_854 [Phytophthora cactorum]|nr:hypothetical protein GQ600_854 [Phytophthora cactorum]